mgnify:CR=1 FL=1
MIVVIAVALLVIAAAGLYSIAAAARERIRWNKRNGW